MNIINLSDFPEEWNWLREEFLGSSRGAGQVWSHYSSLAIRLHRLFPKRDSASRFMAALRAVEAAKSGNAVLVSHGPRPAMYAGAISRILHADTSHLVYSFNFTDLPQGAQRKAMVFSYKSVAKFVCFSSVERLMYSEHFDIPLEKIDMIHWAIHPPRLDVAEDRIEDGQYICAIGGQGRDYRTLFAAIELLPKIRLVVVASKDSVRGLRVPGNVTLHVDVPYSTATNILRNSRFMVVPLRDNKVPCGHVTVVAAMFHSKAIICTDSSGLHDYVKAGETGIFHAPQDVDDLAKKIEHLWEDSKSVEALGKNGLEFAMENCTEQTAISYFDEFLRNHAP